MSETKTPITYYGGKQRMLKEILPKIPAHKVYIEPFFGGGAVFFAKPPSKVEIVNDSNSKLVTFYRALRDDFENLQTLIDQTFHSRDQHKEADLAYKADDTNQLTTAWSVWVQTNMSFSSMIGGGFGYDRGGLCALKLFNKKENFTNAFKERFRKVTIENNDVLKIMKVYDSPDAFFYLDPPYVSSNQGHYAGYTASNFRDLLNFCSTMKGKFLLSTYPEEMLLEEFIPKNGWKTEQHQKSLAVDGRRKTGKIKTECLTWNY